MRNSGRAEARWGKSKGETSEGGLIFTDKEMIGSFLMLLYIENACRRHSLLPESPRVEMS